MSRTAHRRRLISATYEGGGYASKELLRDCVLAVYEKSMNMEEVARMVANLQEQRGCDGGSFYVMDATAVEDSLSQWRECLPFVRPFYDIGCNDDPLLLQLLTANSQCNLLVSSVNELERALCVVEPSRIMFNSPLLTRKTRTLLSSLTQPLHSIVVDDEDSICQLSLLSPLQPILLRVSLSPESDRVELSMGMRVEDVVECLPRLLGEGANIIGLSLQLQTATMMDSVKRANDTVTMLRILSSLGVCLSLVHVGDGLESSCIDDSSCLLDCILTSCSMPSLNLIASPGRFFASSAFALVTSITGKRAIDAGMMTCNDADIGAIGFVYETNESLYTSFGGTLMGEKLECSPLRRNEGETHVSTVLGCTLDIMDIPVRHTRLPSMAVGDRLLWKDMGAYGARDEDGVPVYYYTQRAHWERLKGEEERMMSDGGSDNESDTMEDDDDMSACFGRVFMD